MKSERFLSLRHRKTHCKNDCLKIQELLCKTTLKDAFFTISSSNFYDDLKRQNSIFLVIWSTFLFFFLKKRYQFGFLAFEIQFKTKNPLECSSWENEIKKNSLQDEKKFLSFKKKCVLIHTNVNTFSRLSNLELNSDPQTNKINLKSSSSHWMINESGYWFSNTDFSKIKIHSFFYSNIEKVKSMTKYLIWTN